MPPTGWRIAHFFRDLQQSSPYDIFINGCIDLCRYEKIITPLEEERTDALEMAEEEDKKREEKAQADIIIIPSSPVFFLPMPRIKFQL